jgi:carboxypeptidase Q
MNGIRLSLACVLSIATMLGCANPRGHETEASTEAPVHSMPHATAGTKASAPAAPAASAVAPVASSAAPLASPATPVAGSAAPAASSAAPAAISAARSASSASRAAGSDSHATNSVAHAAPVATPDPRIATIDRIVRAALGHGLAYERLAELCRIAPKRLSGSEGDAAAIAWARETFASDGHEAVRLEPVIVPHWTRGSRAELSVASPAENRSLSLPILALGGSVAAPGGSVRGELVIVESFDELHALGGAKVQGGIVLFNRPMDASDPDPFEAYGHAVDQRGHGAVEAARLGAVAALVRTMTNRIDDVPHTGAMRYDDAVPKIPTAAISTAGADRLATLARSGAKLELVLALDCETLPDVEAANVVAEIRGSEHPEEIVLAGAHLDAWDIGQGAHDDGAGCAEVIEALRLLRELKLVPRRTIRAVLYANEENGLRGGRGYREAHQAELAHHVLAIESDRGGFTPRGFGTDAGPEAFAVLERICALFDSAGGARLVHGDGGADISVLARDGIVLAELMPDPQRYFDFHHCERDVVEAVHPRELELGAAYLAAFLWCVADLDEPLPRGPAK